MIIEKFPIPIKRSNDPESIANQLLFAPIDSQRLRKSAIGKIEPVRIDLKDAIDSIAYGEVSHKGFTEGRIQKLDKVISISQGMAASGVLSGLAAATGVAGVTPEIGISVGLSITILSSTLLTAAKRIQNTTKRDHSQLTKMISDPTIKTQELVSKTIEFSSWKPR